MKLLNKLNKLLAKRNSISFANYLRAKGIKVGENTIFFSPQKITIDTDRPWMVEIGNYCKITAGVIILQHDYSRSVLRREYGEIIGESQKTIIGDNVFIGMNSIILMGSKIGNNVIIGAGSIVHGNIPDNVVIAGNPAKIICSLDDYYKKRKEKTLLEAVETYNEFQKKYNREPSIKEMGSFWQLFLKKDINELKKNRIFTKLNGDNEDEIIDYWINNVKPVFDSYDDFKKYANERRKK